MDKPIPEAVVDAAADAIERIANPKCVNRIACVAFAEAALTAAQQQGQACGTCGETIRPDVLTGTTCACAQQPMQQGGGEVESARRLAVERTLRAALDQETTNG